MQKKLSKLLGTAVIVALFTTSCARNMDSNVYSSSSPAGKVLEGKVISARPIVIKDNDKLQDNGMGMLGGGVAGAVAGSAAGKGTGKGLAVVGGGLIGAVAGALIQDKLSTSDGMEYIVRIDKKYVNDVPDSSRITRHKAVDKNTVDEEVQQSVSVQRTKSDLISVIQGKDIVFASGQKVLIIYNNDRPRLEANN
jgi:outer membrane lipoprotein SlyB